MLHLSNIEKVGIYKPVGKYHEILARTQKCNILGAFTNKENLE